MVDLAAAGARLLVHAGRAVPGDAARAGHREGGVAALQAALDVAGAGGHGGDDRQRERTADLERRVHEAGSEALRRAKKAYAPTELGGVMGYLTAVEEYLARVEEVPVDVRTIYDASKRLESVSYEAARRQRELGYSISFEDAVRQICEP